MCACVLCRWGCGRLCVHLACTGKLCVCVLSVYVWMCASCVRVRFWVWVYRRVYAFHAPEDVHLLMYTLTHTHVLSHAYPPHAHPPYTHAHQTRTHTSSTHTHTRTPQARTRTALGTSWGRLTLTCLTLWNTSTSCSSLSRSSR